MEFDNDDKCPNCGVSWQGEEIPEENREMYGGATHTSRLISVYDRIKDRTTHWKCPDCQMVWPVR